MTGAMTAFVARSFKRPCSLTIVPLLSLRPTEGRGWSMLNKLELQREVSSLDVLIKVLSSEIVREPGYGTPCESPSALMKEMEEALYQLRQARGFRKILLTALDNGCDFEIYKKQTCTTRRNHTPAHFPACRV
jgi:hypothetical protein